MIRKQNDYSQKEPVCDEDTMMLKIADFSVYLQWLNIDGRYLSDAIMIEIVDRCPNIQHLSISRCHNITDTSLVKIAECCHDLKYLDVSESSRKLTDIGIIKIGECCPNLEDLRWQSFVMIFRS
jgi:hypothetical protein